MLHALPIVTTTRPLHAPFEIGAIYGVLWLGWPCLTDKSLVAAEIDVNFDVILNDALNVSSFTFEKVLNSDVILNGTLNEALNVSSVTFDEFTTEPLNLSVFSKIQSKTKSTKK